MPAWLTFLIVALATYRVARMIAEEDGPAFAFKRLRGRFTNDKRSLDVGLRCAYCIGFWAAGLITLYLVTLDAITFSWWPIWWLGAAGAAAKIHEWWKRG